VHPVARRGRTVALSMFVLIAALAVTLWSVTVRASGATDGAFSGVADVAGEASVAGTSGAVAGSAAPAGKVVGQAPSAAKRSGVGPGHTASAAPANATTGQAAGTAAGAGSSQRPAEAASPTTSAPGKAPSTTTPSSTAPPDTAAPTTTGAPPTTTAPATAPTTTAPPARSGARCVVMLHGKGSSGGGSYTGAGGALVLSPSGNDSAWGGLQWLYFPDSAYASARANVAAAIDGAGCTQVIVDGFSNGGAFAAKLFCKGETFGGRLVGVVADDPVPDHGVDGCAPGGGVKVAVYWTGALSATATPGWSCAEQDWTCEGGTTIGIDAYVRALGTSRQASPYSSHQWYQNAPELTSWW
jgi:hypothetical protein